jgi:RNA-binding protein
MPTMRRLGKALHVSKRGSLILRTDKTPPIGPHALVLDKGANKIGTILDVFGPVTNPYVSIRLYEGIDAQKLIGQPLYLRKLDKQKRKR